jgi:aminoglycoside phosphotransferase (APT) family kinase protein
MIEALSKTYGEFAAAGIGARRGDVSVMLVHRPHEDKNYADQSVYFFFLSKEKFPTAVGKVGFDPAGAHYLEREHRGLLSINSLNGGLPPGSFPRPLLFREVAGRRFLLQSALRGEKVSRWIVPGARMTARLSRFLAWAGDWSASLGRSTRGEASALVPVWTEEFTRKLDRTGKSRALLETAARDVWDGFDRSFPSVLAHGDFCGENILDDEGRYGVIDWELCDELSFPLFDILDLCLWVVFRTEGQGEVDPFNALERLLNADDPMARELRSALGRYVRRMGFPQEALPPMLTLAWAGYCLKKFRHLERDETGNFARARAGVKKILETPAGVLAGERARR